MFSLPLSAENIKKFPTNFNGMILEHLINSMLHVEKVNSMDFLLENKKKLKYIGKLPSDTDVVPMRFNLDGTMTSTRPQDKQLEKDINAVIKVLKELIKPLVDFIRNDIFRGQAIKSQDLVIHKEDNIFALCDLSNDNAVLEIKTAKAYTPQSFAHQLYYESNGRKCYILLTNWDRFPQEIIYNIHEVSFEVREHVDSKIVRFENARKKIETDKIKLISYTNVNNPVTLKCSACGHEWSTSYNLAKKHRPCPNCTPVNSLEKKKDKTPILSEDLKMSKQLQNAIIKYERYQARLDEKSEHKLKLLSFKDSRSPAKVKCLICGYEWETRADHLLERCYCTYCKRRNGYSLDDSWEDSIVEYLRTNNLDFLDNRRNREFLWIYGEDIILDHIVFLQQQGVSISKIGNAVLGETESWGTKDVAFFPSFGCSEDESSNILKKEPLMHHGMIFKILQSNSVPYVFSNNKLFINKNYISSDVFQNVKQSDEIGKITTQYRYGIAYWCISMNSAYKQ